MTWELREVKDTECTMDDSGVYTVIHRTADGRVRADLMAVKGSEPIVSFIGTANAVRKALIRYLSNNRIGTHPYISQEHASYIGYELLRAEMDPNYVQD